MGEASSIRGPSDYVHYRPSSPTRVVHNAADLADLVVNRGAGCFPGATAVPAWATPRPREGQMRLVVVHSPHDRCGVREYGAELDLSLSKLVDVVPVPFHAADSAVGALSGGDVMLVHFEPSVVPQQFPRVLEGARGRGAKIVFCCHWFEPRVLQQWGDLVHKFVLHRGGYDLAHDRIAEIPLGCPTWTRARSRSEVRAARGIPQDKTVLLTVGFLSPWKQLPEAIGAVVRAAGAHPQLHIHAQTPLPFFESQTVEHARLLEACAPHGGRVTASTEFLPRADLLDLVGACDVGFVYHPMHTGSVSAATKQFVSARVPVVVTGSSHAADLAAGCRRSGGFDLGSFAHEAVSLAVDGPGLLSLRADMEREYDRVNMDVVAAQYVALARGL